MDRLTFIEKMTGHFLWPLVIVAVLIALRKHLSALADRLQDLSVGNVKVTLREKLEEGAQIVDSNPTIKQIEVKPIPQKPFVSPDSKRAEIARRAQRSRSEAADDTRSGAIIKVIGDLEDVEELLYHIGDAMGMDVASASSALYEMQAKGMVPAKIVQLYKTLRDARNAIINSPGRPVPEELAEYSRQANYLKSAFGNLLDMFPKPGPQG
jgi:hypothetical protein